jgi:pumilio RNA-binding family
MANLGLSENTLLKLNLMQKINKNNSQNSLDDSKNFRHGDFKLSNNSSNNLYHLTNISNSTDELFNHLNKKIDNFDVTNITQNSISLNVNHPEYVPKGFNYISPNNYNNNVYLMFDDDDERQAYGQAMTNLNYKNNDNFNFNQNINSLPTQQMNQKNKIFNTNMFKMQNKNLGKNMASSYADLSDQEIANIAGILAKDQAGCRSLQKRITENPNFANDILFYEIQNCMLDLINDSFGNYLIQKLIDNIEDEKVEWIIDLISPYFIEICASPHGTRVIQKLIENLRNENLLNSFNSVFSQFVISISKDPNANHIIHKYVYTIKYPQNQFLYKMLIENLIDVSTDKHGCCVMQKLIEAADPVQKVKI